MKARILLLALVLIGVGIGVISMVTRDRDQQYDIVVAKVIDIDKESPVELASSEILSRLGEDFSADISYIESSDFKTSLGELSNDIGVDMIWLEGEEQVNMAEELAQKNRSMDYIIMGKTLGADTPKNALGVLFRMEEVSFLSGVLASSISQGGPVGFIGSGDDEDRDIFEYGYRAGVSYLNAESDKEASVHVEYASPAEKNQLEAMEKMIDMEIDLVFMAIEDISKEVFKLAESKGMALIVREGQGGDLESTSIVARVKKNHDAAIYEIIGEFYEGNFRGGNTGLYGLEEGAVDIVYGENSKIRVSDMEKVDIIKNLIRSEKMDIPVDEETFTRYIESIIY